MDNPRSPAIPARNNALFTGPPSNWSRQSFLIVFDFEIRVSFLGFFSSGIVVGYSASSHSCQTKFGGVDRREKSAKWKAGVKSYENGSYVVVRDKRRDKRRGGVDRHQLCAPVSTALGDLI